MSGLSPYEEMIQDFQTLLQNQPELFTEADRDSLTATLQSAPDDIEGLSDAIAAWCEGQPKIYKALMELPLEETSATSRGPGNRPTRLDPKQAKNNLLENMMRRNDQDDKQPESQNPSDSSKQN
ncbi:hypothetical protein [Leptolyngbya sp. GGD]|uniref:hypothetical protein n=1 Tax=Leptolyngbya sp. GGD TaxID=2997907 RepID=UPI00227D2A22|nr:hypothetical protein [Leptolyngbya sp. GGD]MCY6493889.1 hypothetical protein [Leptolyngbya sp. GGD]